MQKKENYKSLRPQCNQIRTQKKETNPEEHNFMETELAPERWLYKQWNEGRNKDAIESNENEDTTCLNLWDTFIFFNFIHLMFFTEFHENRNDQFSAITNIRFPEECFIQKAS